MEFVGQGSLSNGISSARSYLVDVCQDDRNCQLIIVTGRDSIENGYQPSFS